MKQISIHITTKDRPTELALCLQSLINQEHKEWDLVLLDESQQSIQNNFFVACLLNQIKENHYVNVIRNPQSFGVCAARQKLIDEDYFNNDYILRLDDDVIIERDYIIELLCIILEDGYDIASGVTPLIGRMGIQRNVDCIGNIINEKVINKEGEIIKYGDDCGMLYTNKIIRDAHEFRSCALFKKEVFNKIKYPINLSPVGFREEAHISIKALMQGFTIGVNTVAVAWHFASPNGGCRYPDYQDKVQSDDAYFKKWIKELYNDGRLKNVFSRE